MANTTHPRVLGPMPGTMIEDRPQPSERASCSIAGLGCYLPDDRITNEQLSASVDTSDQWIVERTGISGRRRAAPSEATSDLAYLAGMDALNDAGVGPAQLDQIIFATSTPDTPVPATACYLQARLGCAGVPAMDVGAGCAGFGYALDVASAMVKAGVRRNVLVVGADTLTRITNYADRQSCILFGDGAGAVLVSREGYLDVVHSVVGADGSLADLIRVPAGGSRSPASAATVLAGKHTLELRGREVFKFAVRRMVSCVREAAQALGIPVSDFDLVIPHQANARIIEAVGEHLEVPRERLVIDMVDTGNTAAASIPICLARARKRGLLRAGKLVVAVGFGAGVAWSCQVLRIRETAD